MSTDGGNSCRDTRTAVQSHKHDRVREQTEITGAAGLGRGGGWGEGGGEVVEWGMDVALT